MVKRLIKKRRALQLKSFTVMFLSSSISMFKSIKWSDKFPTVSAALPLSDLVVRVHNVTPVSGNVSLVRVFSFRSLSKISLDAEQVASFFFI